MVINTDKTKVMVITTQQKWLKLEKKEPDVFIRGQRLKVVEREKIAGTPA